MQKTTKLSVKIMMDGMSEEPIAIPFPFEIGEYTINNPDDWLAFIRHYEELLAFIHD